MWWIVVLTSGGLIGLGVGLLARDYLRSRTVAAGAAAVMDETRPAALHVAPAPASVIPTPTPRARVSDGAVAPGSADDDLLTGQPLPRLPALEAHWPRMKPEIDAAVDAVNQQMAPWAVAIAAPGEPSWSLHNHGFGDFRRVLVAGDSIGWLRLELAADMRVTAKLRAHDAANTMLNRTSIAPARRAKGQLAASLSDSLKTIADYAAWRHANTAAAPPVTAPQTSAAPTAPVTSAHDRTASDRTATPLSQSAYTGVAALTDEALALVNSAFKDAKAHLRPVSISQWQGAVGRAARVVAITASGAPVAIMLLDPHPDRIELAVHTSDAGADGDTRQTIASTGLSLHELAEAIATLAWPAIAQALQPAG